jgi:hypothetical protein
MKSWSHIQPILNDQTEPRSDLNSELVFYDMQDDCPEYSAFRLSGLLDIYRRLAYDNKLVIKETNFVTKEENPFYVICSKNDSFDIINSQIFRLTNDDKFKDLSIKTDMSFYMAQSPNTIFNREGYFIDGWLAISIEQDTEKTSPHALWFATQDRAKSVLDAIIKEAKPIW